MLSWDVNRREFLKIAAGAGAALAMPTSVFAQPLAGNPASEVRQR